MTGTGHENAFPRPRLSARYRFSQRTFAGTRGNGRDAPIPAVGVIEVKRVKSTLLGYSGFVLGMTLVAPFRSSLDALRSVNREMKWLAVKIEGIVDDWLYAQKPLGGSGTGTAGLVGLLAA